MRAKCTHRRGPAVAVIAVLATLGAPGPAPADEVDTVAEAAPYLEFESVLDGKCHILSQGGKLRLMRNTHPDRTIRYRLMRFHADKPQAGRVVGEIAPGESATKLGCTLVGGREQRWEVLVAEFTGETE